MARPRKERLIRFQPEITYFKPQNVPLRELEEISLTIDELESLRLAECENLSQTMAAEKMQIHQSTFQRNLTRARKKIADALINGKSIKIEGGAFKMPNRDGTGPEGKGPMTGRKQGRCKGNTEEEQRPRLGLGRRDGRGLGRGLGRGRRN